MNTARRSTPFLLGLVLSILCAGWFASSAGAKGINDNDNFADAIDLTGFSSAFGANLNAGKETGEPNHSGNVGGASLWYKFTASVTEKITFDTCGITQFNTLLAVYTADTPGSPVVNDLTETASANDTCDDNESVRISAVAGTTYYIALDGFNAGVSPARGNFDLNVNRAPANDDMADAENLASTLPVSSSGGSNVGATLEPNENSHAGGTGGASVWYEWTAPVGLNGDVTVDTCATSLDTLLGVYADGASLPLTALASDDNGCGLGSKTKFTAVAGTRYLIAVDGKLTLGPEMGIINLKLTETPVNDDLADAAPVSGPLPLNVGGSSDGATAEFAEPDHAGFPAFSSVWHRWEPSANGPVSIDTCGSAFDTRLGVYVGTTPANLQLVATNDDSSGCSPQSRVTFTANTAADYMIAVDGAFSGNYGLTIAEPDVTPPPAPAITSFNPASPANDNSPRVIGTAEAGSTVKLFATANCGGDPVASGSAANFAAAGITATVADNSTTAFRATATDLSGNASGCSAPLSYVEETPAPPADTDPPQTTIDTKPKAKTKTKKKTAKVSFSFSADENASFECKLDKAAFSACSSPLKLKVKKGKHSFAVRAIDSAGNVDASPATYSFKVKRKRR